MAKHFAQIDGGDTGPKPVTEIPVIERASEEVDDEPNLELEVLKSSYDSENLRRVRKKRKTRKNPLLIALAIVGGGLLLLGGLFAYWLATLDHSLKMDPAEQAALVEELTTHDDEVYELLYDSNAFYVLIVGSDARSGLAGARGDVMMLCRVDPDAGTVHLVSIPRDTMIILNGNTEKINAAFAYGGAASAVNAVSKLAGVPITHFVEVGFEGVIDVVDYVGGVWVNVPEPFSGGGYYFDAGEQLLNGEQALAYARQRYAFSGGDFTRSQSQRQIVQGIIDKVLAAPPTELPGLVSALARMISTDMSAGDIASLALKFRENGVKIYSTVAPSYTLWEGDISYVGTMYNEWAELMKRVDAGMDPASTDPIPEPQASSETLGAATNGAAPRDYYDLVDEAGLTTDDIDTPQ